MSSFFRAISSYFSSPSNDNNPPLRNSRRQQALSSTRDAFSLPQHSPSLGNNFSRSSSTESPTAYTYPPRPNSYDQTRLSSDKLDISSALYSDGILGADQSPVSSRRTGHLLPLHRTPLSPLPSYPPLQQTWTRLQAWLSNEYTELGDTLNYGVQPEALAYVEDQLGWSLPPAVRESYLIVDGQEPESSTGCSEGLLFGLTLLPLEDVLAEWSFWREVDNDPSTGANDRLRAQMRSVPPAWVRREYSCRGWLPLVTDRTGNYLGVDLDPGEGGALGQVIVFGRDFDTKVVMRRGEGEGGWATWLAAFVDDLESRTGFELTGQQGDGGSDGSDDNVGYDGYFFNPSGGTRGHSGAEGGQALRLTGEYKGWNVLEAWADKSMRSWEEMGLGLDGVDEQQREQSASVIGLGALALQGNNGAEIPIPVLGEDEAANLAFRSSISEAGPGYSNTSTAGYPTIAITLPPPQPIELPTRADISQPSLFPPLLDGPGEPGDPNEHAAHYAENQTTHPSGGSHTYDIELPGDELTGASLLPLPKSIDTASSILSVSSPSASRHGALPAPLTSHNVSASSLPTTTTEDTSGLSSATDQSIIKHSTSSIMDIDDPSSVVTANV